MSEEVAVPFLSALGWALRGLGGLLGAFWDYFGGILVLLGSSCGLLRLLLGYLGPLLLDMGAPRHV